MAISELPLGDGSGDTWGSAARQFVDGVGHLDTFGATWAAGKQSRLFDVEGKVKSWAETSALLTATASTTWPGESGQVPPVAHLRRGILPSRDARLKALSRALSGRTWRALRTLGVGTEGYLHRHTAVFVGSHVDASAFDGWVSAHTNNSPLAEPSAHQSGTVEVQDVEPDDGLVRYIMHNCPSMDTRGSREHGIKCAPTEQQRGAVVIDRADVAPLSFGHRT